MNDFEAQLFGALARYDQKIMKQKQNETPAAEDARRQYQNLAEEAIDKHGLRQTLEMIAEICWDKAEHIRTNWQDRSTASAWDKASQVVSRASVHRAIAEVSK